MKDIDFNKVEKIINIKNKLNEIEDVYLGIDTYWNITAEEIYRENKFIENYQDITKSFEMNKLQYGEPMLSIFYKDKSSEQVYL